MEECFADIGVDNLCVEFFPGIGEDNKICRDEFELALVDDDGQEFLGQFSYFKQFVECNCACK